MVTILHFTTTPEFRMLAIGASVFFMLGFTTRHFL